MSRNRSVKARVVRGTLITAAVAGAAVVAAGMAMTVAFIFVVATS